MIKRVKELIGKIRAQIETRVSFPLQRVVSVLGRVMRDFIVMFLLLTLALVFNEYVWKTQLNLFTFWAGLLWAEYWR